MRPLEKKDSKIYQFMDDSPAFSACNLDGATHPGTCCNPIQKSITGRKLYYCADGGVHFHCNKHLDVPLYKKKVIRQVIDDIVGSYDNECEVWWCDKCQTEDSKYSGHDFDEEEHKRRARTFITSEEYKHPQVIRIDDQLVQIEFKKAKMPKGESDYYSAWGNIETDKDGNPQINLYLALKSMGGKKAHYFIEPELGRLREEVKGINIDPGEIISKIEITTRKAKISKEYKTDD